MKPHSKFRRSAAPESTTSESPNNDAAGHETKGPRRVIEQAARDISRGLRDTDQHGTPSDVPGPGPAPEQSPGADVSEEGPDVRGAPKPSTHGSR